MRLFHILFAFYIITLSMVPCNDVCTQESVAMEQGHSDSDHAEHTDQCSPFCICSCCGASIAFLNFESFEISNTVDMEPTQPACYDQSAVSLFNPTIWQPPKI